MKLHNKHCHTNFTVKLIVFASLLCFSITIYTQSNIQNFKLTAFQQAANCTYEYEDMTMKMQDTNFPPGPYCGPIPVNTYDASNASIIKTFLPGTKIKIVENTLCFSTFFAVYCEGNQLSGEFISSDPFTFSYDVTDGIVDSLLVCDVECGIFEAGDRFDFTIENSVFELSHFQTPNRANSTAIELNKVKLLEENKPEFKLTADGSQSSVFKLVIKENPADVDLSDLSLKMRVKEDPNSMDSDLYGSFSINTVNITSSKIDFKYTHPDYIPEGGNSNLTIELVDSIKNVVLDEFPLKLFRAPVLLIHGLWSNDQTFVQMESFLASKGFERELLFKVSYEGKNAVNFASNNSVVPGGILSLQARAENRSIATGKVNIVGHSMGGILTRLYLQSAAYKNDISKFITINTPHSGSQIANFILSNDVRAIAARPIFKLKNMPTDKGAISDLRVNGSAILVDLNGPSLNANTVPSHAIASRTGLAVEVIQATDNLILQGSIYAVMMKLGMDDPFLNTVYGEPHDIIVPYSSQLGGLAGANTTTFLGPSHIENQQFFGSSTVVSNLFNSPSSDPAFSQTGFAPPVLTYTQPIAPDPSPEVASRTNAGTVSITNPLDGQSFSTLDNIDIEISGTSDIDSIYCLVSYSIDSSYVGRQIGNNASFDYNDPMKTGTVSIVAVGFDSGGAIVLDSIFINICDTSLNLNLPIYATNNYNSANQIMATGGVEDQANVLFEAGTEVILSPIFYVEKGATFHAKIGDCNSKNGILEENEIKIRDK